MIPYGDGWVPNASRPQYPDVTEFVPQFRQMAAEAGCDPATIPVTIFGAPENADRIKRYRAQGIARVVVSLPSPDRTATFAGAGPLGRADPQSCELICLPGYFG